MGYNPTFSNGYKNAAGTLSEDEPTRRGGRRVLTWAFRAVTTRERAEGAKVTVDVMLERGEEGLRFRARSDRLPATMVNTDINELHREVEAALMKQATQLSGIMWEDWYEVVVSGANSEFEQSEHSAMGANLQIQVNRLKRGLDPTTGEPVTINRNNVVVGFPKAQSLSEGAKTEGTFFREPAHERSYLQATQANREALASILKRMECLRENLAQLLAQDVVQERLGTVGSLMPRLVEAKPGV